MSTLPPPPPVNARGSRTNRILIVVVMVLVVVIIGLGGFLIGSRPSQDVSPSSSAISTSLTSPPSVEPLDSADQELAAWQSRFEEDLLQMRSSLQSFRAISSGWVESTSLFDSASDLIDRAFQQAPKAPNGMSWDSWLEIQDAVTSLEEAYFPGFRVFGEQVFLEGNGRYPEMADDGILMDWWRQNARDSEVFFPAADPESVARTAIAAIDSLVDAMN